MGDGYYYDSYDISEAREQGAEIMRDKMIEEACKWLFENVYDRHCPEDQERVESFKKDWRIRNESACNSNGRDCRS